MATIPPDGGWGWIVVFSSLVCNILIDGIGLAYGVLLPKFAEYFDAPKSKVSLMGSVLIGTYMCTGPIAGGLANKFGCRVVCIAGSVLSASGFIAASFSPNLNILIITYGVIGGLGFGMIYLPAIVSVGEYFERKRPLATGIAVCGSGLGTFIFAPMMEYLSEIYDWRSMLIIIAGILLNGVVCGMLYRPLNNNATKSIRIEYSEKRVEEEVNGDVFSEEKKPFIRIREVQTHANETSLESYNCKSQDNHLDKETGYLMSVQNELDESLDCEIPSPVNTNTFDQKKNSRFIVFLRKINEIFDLSLFCNIPFVLLCVGNVFAAAAYYIPFLYLVDNALMLGISHTAAPWLLSTIGIMNIIGRILAGGLATLKRVNTLLLNNVAICVAAVTLFLLPSLKNYPELLIFCVFYGLCVATFVSLTSIILCDLLGVERLASAFGHLGVARGISSVVGPLLAGLVYESTGNYGGSFYFGGSMFLAASILHFIIMLPCLKQYVRPEIQ